jgi:Plavaka transposase
MFHAIWRILIDDDFLDAYRNGIVIKCHDGVYRRVFPRIFTYSADYPEKCVECVLLTLFLLIRP